VADAVAVDTWDARGVRLTDVVAALADLRHQSSNRTAIRTAVMTLVAVSGDDEKTYATTRALRALGGHHPARIVAVRPDADAVATLDGRAALFAVANEGHQIHFEEVTLMVGGQAALHLDSVIEPFTLSDLPVVVWYVGSVPDPRDPLLAVATTVLVDSRDAAGSGQLRELLELARRRTVVDFCWLRLRPWRELASGLFDPPEGREWLESVSSVQVTGKAGPRLLLGGWLAERLRLRPDQISLVPGRHVEIRITCQRDGATGIFDVVRGEEARTVAARAILPSGGWEAQTLVLADDPLSTSLSFALTHLEPDHIWERALSVASVMLDV
jgi:glucose-6-phosphate dehydrogenase assembly protein OpcA